MSKKGIRSGSTVQDRYHGDFHRRGFDKSIVLFGFVGGKIISRDSNIPRHREFSWEGVSLG